jgi:hypothetical protein
VDMIIKRIEQHDITFSFLDHSTSKIHNKKRGFRQQSESNTTAILRRIIGLSHDINIDDIRIHPQKLHIVEKIFANEFLSRRVLNRTEMID